MANFLECRKAEVQHPRNPLLEAAPIGWQLFVLESGKSASIAFLLLLATYATRLLAQALMEAMKATLRRLWRLTRASSIVVGLAVMVALVGGVVSLALAKPPAGGEPPPSGGETAASILKGVTNTATAVTTLINSGTGAALNLVVQPGEPPLTVNPEAGTATNLSADKLDGLDSADFLGATAKAADSDKLDGKDSTDFAAASIGTVYTDRTPLFSQDQSDFGGVRIPNDGNIVVVSTQVPADNYAINAKGILENMDDDDPGVAHCQLEANGGQVDIQMPFTLDERFEIGSEEAFALQGVLKDFEGGQIAMRCFEGGNSDQVDAKLAALTAIRVGSVQ